MRADPQPRLLERSARWSSLFLGIVAAQLLFLDAGRAIAGSDGAASLLLAGAAVLVACVAGLQRVGVLTLFFLATATSAVALTARAGWLGVGPFATQAFSAMALAQIVLCLPIAIRAVSSRSTSRRR